MPRSAKFAGPTSFSVFASIEVRFSASISFFSLFAGAGFFAAGAAVVVAQPRTSACEITGMPSSAAFSSFFGPGSRPAST